MSAPDHIPVTDPFQLAYQEGRRLGLATAALALSVVAFLNLLGFEKSILAGVLAFLSLQGAAPAVRTLRRGRVALAIVVLHVVTIAGVLALFHDKLRELIHLLHKLG
jgi:hypothetical protein